MAFIEFGNEGASNGVTAVTMVAAPRKTGVKHVIRWWSVYNPDATAQKAKVQINKNGTKRLIWASASLAQFVSESKEQVVVLDGTDESLELLLTSAPAATQWDFCVAYAQVDNTE